MLIISTGMTTDYHNCDISRVDKYRDFVRNTSVLCNQAEGNAMSTYQMNIINKGWKRKTAGKGVVMATYENTLNAYFENTNKMKK